MNTTEKLTETTATTKINNGTTNTKQVFVRNKEIEKVFIEYQKARQTFATKIADLSRFPRNVQDLEEGGAMNILRALLLDSIPSIQQSAALALGRLANYSPELASGKKFIFSKKNLLFIHFSGIFHGLVKNYHSSTGKTQKQLSLLEKFFHNSFTHSQKIINTSRNPQHLF